MGPEARDWEDWMTRRRILVCLDSLAAGGAERQTVQLVRGLNRERFKVQVVCLHGPRMHQSRHFVGDLQADAFVVRELDRYWNRSELIPSLFAIRRCIQDFQPDLVHSVSHHCNHLTRFVRLLAGHRFRLLTAIRTDYNTRQLRNERLEQWLSTAIVCNSPSMEVKLRESAGIGAKRLSYIPNGLDVKRFSENPDPGLRSRLAPGIRRVGVMLARITEQKSPDLLAKAVGELRRRGQLPEDVRLWIVGEQESAEVQMRLEKVIQQHDLKNCIQQFPPTQQPEAYLHAADFSILASLWEGTPNSVLESLAAGKPALVSKGANACGLIQPGREGWEVRTGDTEDLADRLREILQLPDPTIAAMKEPCQQKAREFDLPTMVCRYESLYEDLLR